MAATIRDVGRLAGVSRSTVSRVINRKGDVDARTEKNVWEAVKQLNYHPNTSARALVRQRTDTIGVMLADVSHPFSDKLIKGIQAVADTEGFGVAYYNTNDDLNSHRQIINTALDGAKVDGLIVVGSHLGDKQLLREISNRALCLALVERNFPDPAIPCVSVDNKAGAMMAVEHLIGLGHRRIGLITGNLSFQTAVDRMEGYKEALRRHGLPIAEELIAAAEYTTETGSVAMKHLLALPKPPTAVFACNDMMALNAMQIIGESGLRVPEDVAVVGFDDIVFASMVFPQLTTIRQPLYQMGFLAAQGLIERLRKGNKAEPFKKVLPVELVVRRSCGAGSLPHAAAAETRA